MAQIKNDAQYKAAQQRIEELLRVVTNETPVYDKNFIELNRISDMVVDYEELHYPLDPLR